MIFKSLVISPLEFSLMTVSLAIQTEIADLRQKAREGTMTLEDARRGLVILRADRIAMPASKSAPRTKKVGINADDLLGELGI